VAFVLHILLALATIGTVQAGLALGVRLPLVVPLLCGVPYLLGLSVRSLLHRGRFRAAGALALLLGHAPPLLYAVAVLAFGWVRAVEGWLGEEASLTEWPRTALLFALVPFVLFELCTIDVRARLTGIRDDTVRGTRSFQSRLFLSALAPFVLYVGLSMLVGLDEELRVRVEEVSLYGAGFSLLLLAVFVLLIPSLLRRTWETEALEPGPLRARLETLAGEARFRFRDLLVWKTGGTVANAAIVGFTPKSRIVLFTDALLAHLDPTQLGAVFAHEMGHAMRHHVMVFIVFTLACFLGADLALAGLDVQGELYPGLAFGVTLCVWYLCFGFMSRRFELDADLVSVELLGDSRPIVEALREVTGAHAHGRSSWRHFSTRQRGEFLQRADADPRVARRLRRVLRGFAAASALALAVCLALELRALAGSLPADQVVADLRLGRFERARERVERGAEVQGPLRALVALAASLPAGVGGGKGAADELEVRAQRALALGETERAAGLLHLAVLRGARELEPTRRALVLLEEGDAGAARDLAPEVSERWRAALGL
jgi:Zn-dependent protease with chaperone function